jgi:hypothetical protein
MPKGIDELNPIYLSVTHFRTSALQSVFPLGDNSLCPENYLKKIKLSTVQNAKKRLSLVVIICHPL